MPVAVAPQPPQIAPLDDVVRVVQVFASTPWPYPEAGIPDLVERLGWRLISPPDAEFPEADTSLPLQWATADFMSLDGELNGILFRVTDVVDDEAPWRADFVNDAYVTTIRAISTALGKPDQRGRTPDSRYTYWELATGGRITLYAFTSHLAIDVISAMYADLDRSQTR